LSQSSGTLIGIYPIPDEKNIEWSSGEYLEGQQLKQIIQRFTIMGNWIMNDNQLIDPLGRYVDITTGLVDNHGNVFIGTDNGSFFHASNAVEIFSPIKMGISNTDVSSLFLDNGKLWIGSSDYESSKGISWLNISSGETRLFEFDGTINMGPISIFEINVFQSELWASGEGMALFHSFDRDDWKTYGEEIGISNGKIWDIVSDSSFIWFASSKGICRIDRKSQRQSNIGIESIYNRIPVYDLDIIDNELWIGSRSGLHVFNINHPQLIQAEKLGQKFFPEPLLHITAINEYDGVIYVAGSMGIAKFDKYERKWDLVFPSAFYHGEIVYSMKIQRNQMFLGTKRGLVRINLKTGFTREYFFPFIGQVNDIELDNNIVWLGTSNGLIKFKWKRDL
jgi:ligand-binding sensor domain-containing protein